MNILHELNEKQTEAVIHKDGPILVIAGPGTGKTKVITHRIAYLIRHHKIKPDSILAITFTNKAAEEMRDRVDNEIGDPHGSNIKVNTFHAFCVKALREHAQHIGLSDNFTIFDQETQDEIFIEIVRDLNLNPYSYPPWRLRNFVSVAKSKLDQTSDELYIDSEMVAEIDEPYADVAVEEILNAYQDKLIHYNALDFDDLLIKAVTLFHQVKEVRHAYQQEISHILVDEYHDVNNVQYRLLQLICSAPAHNVMVVADRDQSIYSWRGSNPQYIDNFKTDFNPKIVILDEHYRCTGIILRAAEEVIKKNLLREDQYNLTTHKDDGNDIFHYTFTTPSEEAQNIVKIIKKLVKQRNVSFRDIAVFYRTHKLADVLEEELIRTKVKFQRIRANSSYDDENLKGMLAYLRFVRWKLPRDLENAINFPIKRLDDLTWVRLKWLAERNRITLIELLRNIHDFSDDVGPLTRANIEKFWEQIECLSDLTEEEDIHTIIKQLFWRLDLFRSPYRSKELEVIESAKEIPNLNLAIDLLYSAIDRGENIEIVASYGIDTYCAADIIYKTLIDYLKQHADINFLPSDMRTDDRGYLYKSTYIVRGYRRVKENVVRIYIGDYVEIEQKEESQTILIGNTDDLSGIVHLKTDEVYSITALKLSQSLLSRFESPNMGDMVIYDLETTGINIKHANIVEIAGMRLNADGEEIDSFDRLVKPPGGYIPASATKVHGISSKDVADAPSIEIVLPEFCSFIKDRILIGHNVAEYDNPILERDLRNLLKINLSNPYYDTLVTARKLLPRQRRDLQSLAEKFGIQYNRLHRAMKDVEVNRKIFKELIKIDLKKRQVQSLTDYLPLIGLGILEKIGVPEQNDNITEVGAFLNAVIRVVKADKYPIYEDIPFDDAEEEKVEGYFDALAEANIPSFQEDTEWIEARAKLRNLLVQFDRTDYEGTLSDFLDYQKLLTNFDEIDDKTDQVTLMTLHAAKGTEYPVVIIIGMEEGSFPMWKPEMTQEEIEEERRLFYVGMTRAQERLYLSSTVYRYGDRERSTSLFIHEMPDDHIVKWSLYQAL